MTVESKPREIVVRYFAWVREKTGVSQETISLGDDIATIADLVQFLRLRGPEFEAAFANTGSVRAALDKAHVKADARIGGAREIAFFPPVTGG